MFFCSLYSISEDLYSPYKSSQPLSTPEAPSLSPGFSPWISFVSLPKVSAGKQIAVKPHKCYIKLHVNLGTFWTHSTLFMFASGMHGNLSETLIILTVITCFCSSLQKDNQAFWI